MLSKLIKIVPVFLLIITVSNSSLAEEPKTDNSWMKYDNPYAKSAALDTANITGNEVVAWAQNTVSEIFTFSNQDYSQRLVQFKTRDFSKPGWLKYAQFLKESEIIKAVTDQQQSIASIVPEVPLIIDEKVIDNEFHWILKMKNSISFFVLTDRGEKRTIKSGDYIIYLDIKRVEQTDTANELGIAINDIRLTPNIEGK